VPLDDATLGVAASALASLTADPTELSPSAKSGALAAATTFLSLALPTNVLTGAANDSAWSEGSGGGSAGGSAGGRAAGLGPNVSSVPAFPPSVGSSLLGVVVAILGAPDSPLPTGWESGVAPPLSANASSSSSGSGSGGGGGGGSAANGTDGDSLRAQVRGTVSLLSSAMLRNAVPGDAPQTIYAGPPTAFQTTSGGSSGGSLNLGGGYCGSALALTAVRVLPSSLAASARTAANVSISLGAPLAPCFASTLSSSSGANSFAPPSPSVTLPPLFFAGSAAATSVADVVIVQNGLSPVPETVGFTSLRYIGPTAGAAGAALTGAGAAGVATGSNASANGTAVAATLRSALMGARALQSSGGGGGSVSPSRSPAPFPAAANPSPGTTNAAAALALSTGVSTAASLATGAAAFLDLDPSRGLDTRVLSITLQARNGAALSVSGAAAPALITLPLRDPATLSGAFAFANSAVVRT
jgi:hypothetical protein